MRRLRSCWPLVTERRARQRAQTAFWHGVRAARAEVDGARVVAFQEAGR